MIPKVRQWKITVNETGEVLYFDTINKNMVRIILKLDYARLWGNTFKISVVKEKHTCQAGGAPCRACRNGYRK